MSENAQHDDRFDLDPGQFEALAATYADDANLGDDLGIACNVTNAEHVHARRVGPSGSGLGGRVVVLTHGSQGHAMVYIAAPQARMLAAHLLNAADDLDGKTPLAFLPRFPDEAEPEPADVVDAEIVEDVAVEEIRPLPLPVYLARFAFAFPVGVVRGFRAR